MANSKLKCKECKEYHPRESGIKTPGGWFCSTQHATSFAIRKRNADTQRAIKRDQQEFRRETRARKEKLKSKSDWLKEAQSVFNKWIRLRDEMEPCISCGRHHQGQYHAGHYRSVGAQPALRFNENNVSKQCAPCNNHLSGNISGYRPRLIEKYGQAVVDDLEREHEPLRLTIDQIKAIKADYKQRVKELEKCAI